MYGLIQGVWVKSIQEFKTFNDSWKRIEGTFLDGTILIKVSPCCLWIFFRIHINKKNGTIVMCEYFFSLHDKQSKLAFVDNGF